MCDNRDPQETIVDLEYKIVLLENLLNRSMATSHRILYGYELILEKYKLCVDREPYPSPSKSPTPIPN